jgi:hypothetical protein
MPRERKVSPHEAVIVMTPSTRYRRNVMEWVVMEQQLTGVS